jgi:hypothetical protein
MTTQSTATATIGRPMEGLALRAPALRIVKERVGAEFFAAYPDYVTTAALDKLRAAEYPYLDSAGHVYLDYAGAGLAADAQFRAHAGRVRGGCFGNPHSENPASRASTVLIEQARDARLEARRPRAATTAALLTGPETCAYLRPAPIPEIMFDNAKGS